MVSPVRHTSNRHIFKKAVVIAAAALLVLACSIGVAAAVNPEFRAYLMSLFVKDVTGDLRPYFWKEEYYFRDGFLISGTADNQRVYAYTDGSLTECPIQTCEGTYSYRNQRLPFRFRYVLSGDHFTVLEEDSVITFTVSLLDGEKRLGVFETLNIAIADALPEGKTVTEDSIQDAWMIRLDTGELSALVNMTGSEAFFDRRVPHDTDEASDAPRYWNRRWADCTVSPDGKTVLFSTNRDCFQSETKEYDYYIHDIESGQEWKIDLPHGRQKPDSFWWEDNDTVLFDYIMADSEGEYQEITKVTLPTKTAEILPQSRFPADGSSGTLSRGAAYVYELKNGAVVCTDRLTGKQTVFPDERYSAYTVNFSEYSGDRRYLILGRSQAASSYTEVIGFYDLQSGKSVCFDSRDFEGNTVQWLSEMEPGVFVAEVSRAGEDSPSFYVLSIGQ